MVTLHGLAFAVPEAELMTVRAARIDGSGTPTDRDIAVTIEASSAEERVDLFTRAFGLTARERQLVEHLVAGNDTRDVARLMFLSQNTVQDHLKSIFSKPSPGAGVPCSREPWVPELRPEGLYSL